MITSGKLEARDKLAGSSQLDIVDFSIASRKPDCLTQVPLSFTLYRFCDYLLKGHFGMTSSVKTIDLPYYRNPISTKHQGVDIDVSASQVGSPTPVPEGSVVEGA